MKFFETGIKGSCYIEFVQGKWTGEHWNVDSLYLHDDDFFGLEAYTNPFTEVIPNFAHWGVTEVTFDDWKRIVEVSRKLDNETKKIIKELRPWAEKNFRSNDVFTIIGIMEGRKFFRTGIKGGCYNEFVQGKWTDGDREHWSADSLYLYDEVFEFLDLYTNLFAKVIPNYAHFGVTEVTCDDWKRLVEISREQGGEIEMLIEELRPWAEENFRKNKIFTILGI
ncbi:MAG: hypothetical protein K2N56_10165 [Oscillospiraceae bacterium]|nr:hypothetical protein [Oscillospiraceae bacterium]